ncbi:ZIP transporter family protein [Abortiporus biennis]
MRRREYIQLLRRDSTDALNCGSGGGSDDLFPLRVASIFIILVGALFGALFPVLAKRTRWLNSKVPNEVFDFAKYFGSGVIIATAFIHLLDPAIQALGSPCLPEGWSKYPYALAISLVSIFSIFIIEIVAFRWGTAKLAALGLSHDPHGHAVGGHTAHGPEPTKASSSPTSPTSQLPPPIPLPGTEEKDQSVDLESGRPSHSSIHGSTLTRIFSHGGSHHAHHHLHEGEKHPHSGAIVDSGLTQIVGVGILEFGVVLHSLLIGLTLAVDPDFKILFIVLVFHQTFEGLGVGSRLAFMDLPHKYNYVPIVGAIMYGVTTPIGIAIGLGVRTTYNPGSTTASIVSGCLDAFSAGILIYTGLVELLAHEFLFNREMINGSNAKMAYAIICMMLGCGVMALLGKWA